jgi:hypothetical protein
MFGINAACPVNVCPFGAFFLQAVRTSVDEATATFGARRAKHAPAIAHSRLNNENGPNIVGISYYDEPWLILATHCVFVAKVSPANNSSTPAIDIFCSVIKSEF